MEDVRGIRYAAELSALGLGMERAVVDAPTHEELAGLVSSAVHAFAMAVRLRMWQRSVVKSQS